MSLRVCASQARAHLYTSIYHFSFIVNGFFAYKHIFLLLINFTMAHISSCILPCFPACKSRPLAPRASRLFERFATALCHRALHAASAVDKCGCQSRRAARWRWPCLVLPPACFLPGRYAAAGAPQVLSRVAQPPSERGVPLIGSKA